MGGRGSRRTLSGGVLWSPAWSDAQAWEANRRLAKADRERPIRGRNAERRHRLRMGGIISAVRGSRVGNSAFGRSLHGHRGGRGMAVHGLHHLRAIAPLGAQAAQAAREGKKALEFWERTGQVLPLKERQARQTPLQQQLEAWERQQEQPCGQTLRRTPMEQWLEEWEQQRHPKDFMAW